MKNGRIDIMIIENCPKCGSKLVKGTYYTDAEKGKIVSFLVFGASAPQHLWFKNNDQGAKKELCIKCNDPNTSFKCGGCGLMIIDSPLQPPTLIPEFPSIATKGV
jgi:hypothetical protein